MSDLPLFIPMDMAFGGKVGNVSSGVAGRLGFSVDVDPSPVILFKMFNDFADDIRSLKEPLERSVRLVLAPSIRKNFEVEGRPQWQELNHLTTATKRRKGYRDPERILYATGTLARVAGQLNIWTIDGGYQSGEASAYIGELPQKAWYGKVHQTGISMQTRARDEFSDMTIPARPWALIQEEDVDAIELVFYEWVEERAAILAERRF